MTNDSWIPEGVAKIAADSRRYLSPCYQIRSSAPLAYIVANPTEADLVQGGYWNTGLSARARSWFTFQPYITALGTTANQNSDVASIETFVASVASGPSSGQKYFIYQAWPSVTNIAGNYQAYWDQDVVDAGATATIMKRAYFDNLYNALTSVSSRYIIPIGEVMNEIDVQARAGNLPGIATVADLYRDDLHQGTCGRFVAGATMAACFFKMKTAASSATVTAYNALGGSALTLTTQLAALFETIIWDVVTADARTGI